MWGYYARGCAASSGCGEINRAKRGVVEGGGGVLVILGQSKPGLQAKKRQRAFARLVIGTIGIGNSQPCRHQIDPSRSDAAIRAKRIAMVHPAFLQIGDGGKPDMGVWAHINPLPRQKLWRTHLIKKMNLPTI